MSSVQKRFIRRAVVVLVALYAYLGYTYLASVYTDLASLDVYVLYAFTGFYSPVWFRLGPGSYFEYMRSRLTEAVREYMSELVGSALWLTIPVVVSVGIALGYTALSGRNTRRVPVACLIYGVVFVVSNLVIEPAAGARGLYPESSTRLLETDLLICAQLLLFPAFLIALVLTGTITDLLRWIGPSDSAET